MATTNMEFNKKTPNFSSLKKFYETRQSIKQFKRSETNVEEPGRAKAKRFSQKFKENAKKSKHKKSFKTLEKS